LFVYGFAAQARSVVIKLLIAALGVSTQEC